MQKKLICTIEMGNDTEPDYLKADSIILRLYSSGETEGVKRWMQRKLKSLYLRDEIINAVESDGECFLNWACEGEHRFNAHATMWEYTLQQYKFTIKPHYCHVSKP